ncbi:MAG TPA: hypothetical protein VH475_27680 [Tepidisphaeraceae bacterium]|jgi:hypothetical protein
MRHTSGLPHALACPCLVVLLLIVAGVSAAAADGPHFYIFFNRDRERIAERTFLDTPAIEGAQLKYTWPQLEHAKDEYDFADIRHDLAFLKAHGKRLFIQVQDASFDPSIVPIPRYLQNDPAYHGGADPQYDIPHDDETRATPAGWVARRWDPTVRERFGRLLRALGKEFDGQIEGINLPETAVDFGERGRLYPRGFTPEVYRDAVVGNMATLKRAFPRSVAIQYANFMPEANGDAQHTFLKSVYQKASELKVGVGGPDLLPYKPGQMANSYPLLREYAGRVPTGIAVQDGNYAHRDPKTGKQVTIADLVGFATDYLRVNYIFCCTEEPFYSRDLIPLLQAQRARGK